MLEFSPMNIKIWSRLGACGSFGQAALSLPEVNPNSIVCTADLTSFSGLERFKNTFPDRLYNFGIAEQNMVCVAAGMAKEGFTPFITTYAAFLSLRCADQMKVSLGYMGLGVKVVGMASGYSVGILGATHMCLEDVSLIRSIPNIVIISPADCTSVVKAAWAVAQTKDPVYLRLTGSMNMPIVYNSDFDFKIGEAITLKEGSDISIIATGSMVFNSLKAAELLEEHGISVEVLDMHTIKPLDLDAVRNSCKKKMIVTIEEHSRYGGLGGAVAEVLCLNRSRPPHLIIGTEGEYLHASNYKHLIESSNLAPEQLFEKILITYKELA